MSNGIWTKLNLLLLSLLLTIFGILILAISYLGIVSETSYWANPISDILRSIGVAFILSGTVSFGVQELVRAKTKNEFEIQLRNLLSKANDNLSAELRDFLSSYIVELGKRIESLGVETHGSKIIGIYSYREKGLPALAQAINDSEKFVYIMGISLRQFFSDTVCGQAINNIYDNEDKKIEFKILILNNKSSDALDRSRREEGINFESIEDSSYKRKTLYRETEDTIETIDKSYSKMKCRVYDQLSLFLLITDKVVFMEPYHYGDRMEKKSDRPHLKRMAELVPLIEFEKSKDKGPYEQFLGHFNYVLGKSSEYKK